MGLCIFLVSVLIDNILNSVYLCSTIIGVHNNVLAAASLLRLHNHICNVGIGSSLSLLLLDLSGRILMTLGVLMALNLDCLGICLYIFLLVFLVVGHFDGCVRV